MVDGTPAKVPGHFWPVVALSLVWNAYGGYDYTMTKLQDPGYLKMFPPEMLGWVDAMPAWATALWALGVWGSVAGSILLLMRSRHAVTAFIISLVGAVLSFAYQFFGSAMPASLDTPGYKAMVGVILLAVVFFWWYARRCRNAGILR